MSSELTTRLNPKRLLEEGCRKKRAARKGLLEKGLPENLGRQSCRRQGVVTVAVTSDRLHDD